MNEPLRLRFVTDSCLLVINTKGRIKVLYTPFRVLAIITAEGLSENTHVYVEAVFHHKQHRICYHINGKVYPYNYFQINISF